MGLLGEAELDGHMCELQHCNSTLQISIADALYGCAAEASCRVVRLWLVRNSRNVLERLFFTHIIGRRKVRLRADC